jgi:hypothetical protein
MKNTFKVEGFHLNCVKSSKTEKIFGFVKEMINSPKVEFKAVPSFLFAQVFKKYYNLKIEELDRKFIHEGMLATFDLEIE